MTQDEIYKLVFLEIHYYAVKGLRDLPEGSAAPDMSLQIAELFVAEEDEKWVRNFEMKPVPIRLLKDPQKALLEICRVCYPDFKKGYDLKQMLLDCRNLSGRFLTDDEKAAPFEPITLLGFVYMAGILREWLSESFELTEVDIQQSLDYWENRLRHAP